MKTTIISISKIIDNDVVKEADQMIAEELKELNRYSKYCYTAAEIAKSYRMKGNDLTSFLKDRKIIKKVNGNYMPTARYQNQGLTSYRYSLKYNQHGQRKIKMTLVWTEKGKQFLKELIMN